MEDFMRTTSAVALGFLAAVVAWTVPGHAQDQKPTVKIPEPGVPEIMTIEGHFVRVAYNNEGYVVLGYETANRSVGETWMLLELGITVREGVKNQKLTRSAFSLDTPDGKTLPLPSIEEYRKNEAKLQALQQRLKVQGDSIDYFPPWVHGANRLGFFSDLGSRALPWDETEVTNSRACLGQLYFHIPGGTKYGQYWLNVKFAESTVRVPFRLFTKEEEKKLGKNYSSIKKQIDKAFKDATKKKK
jgi:hypothetical protein